MRVIRKILYALIAVLALFCLLIMVCAFNPEAADKIGSMVSTDSRRTEAADAETDSTDGLGDAVNLSQGGNGGVQGDRAENAVTREERPAVSSIQPVRREENNRDADGLSGDNKAGYVAPRESDIVIPGDVSGRNGYIQIQGDAQQVDDTTADDLQNRLDAGFTGDGLTFDPLYYPYYAMLDEEGKHVYRQIYANADAVFSTFMPVEEVTAAQLRNIFSAVYNDHPELFWLETAYACKYTSAGQCIEIDLRFNRLTQNLGSAKEAFNKQVDGIIEEAQKLSDNYSKEKYVHNELIDRISYDTRAEMNQSAYSALVNGETVCAGYSRAFQYIMMQLNIPCYYCTGFAGENHAWNIIQLSDGFYNVDTTWDDTDGGNYNYFNKTDDDYASNHIRKELSVYLPPCDGQQYRNLEQKPDNSPQNGSETSEEDRKTLRSLADVGIAEDQVFSDMGYYYEDCYNQVVKNGVGHYTFYNAVASEQMANEILQSYGTEICWDTYMENATSAVGAHRCSWIVSVEPLQDGKYFVTHEISMTQ
ncbi:MAG: hypothetical protein J1F18_05950 [Lachnospiraceae bacterium]|nr:hypothetical protein [Lachnospiraceae bacterium]